MNIFVRLFKTGSLYIALADLEHLVTRSTSEVCLPVILRIRIRVWPTKHSLCLHTILGKLEHYLFVF